MEASDQLHAPADLPKGTKPLVPIEWEAGKVPEQVWTLWRRVTSFTYRTSIRFDLTWVIVSDKRYTGIRCQNRRICLFNTFMTQTRFDSIRPDSSRLCYVTATWDDVNAYPQFHPTRLELISLDVCIMTRGMQKLFIKEIGMSLKHLSEPHSIPLCVVELGHSADTNILFRKFTTVNFNFYNSSPSYYH
jgi:hypothetical protein